MEEKLNGYDSWKKMQKTLEDFEESLRLIKQYPLKPIMIPPKDLHWKILDSNNL